MTKYPDYVSQLPEGWESTTVGESFHVIGGGTPSTEKKEYWEGKIPWISSADISGESSITPRRYITQDAIINSATSLIPSGSIIVVTRVGLGKVALANFPLCISQDSQALILQNHKIDTKFALYFLSRAAKSFEYQGRGTTVSGITKKELKELFIPVPPISEQYKISQILSTWDRAIERVQRLIEAKQRQKKGLMQGLLTGKLRFPEFGEPAHKKDEIPNEWSLLRLNQIGSLKAGGTPSTFVPQYWGGEIPWMNSGELNLKFVNSVNGRITESGMKNSNTSMVPRHSVLVGLAGQGKTRGTVAVNEFPLCTNQSIAAIMPRVGQAHYLFLYYNLDSRYQELRRMSAGDGGRGGLTLSILGNLHVALPKLDEQIQIAQCLFLIDQNIKILESKKQMLNHQKNGLMQKLLTGEIRVTVD